jgi:hypothetical protein
MLRHNTLAITYTTVVPDVARAAAEEAAAIVPRRDVPKGGSGATNTPLAPAQNTTGRSSRRKKAQAKHGCAARGSNPEPAD